MLWNEAKGAEKHGKTKIFGQRWLLNEKKWLNLPDFFDVSRKRFVPRVARL